MLRLLFILGIFGCLACASSTDRPIIGVLSLPTKSQYGRSYIAASYVKFLEAAGARVAPIKYTDSFETITNLFSSLNGVLFTGGGDELNGTYFAVEQLLFKLVLDANNRGEHVPLWGTCLGFEAISMIVAGGDIRTFCDAENISMALEMEPTARNSRLFGGLTDTEYRTLSQKPVTLNNHQWCLKTDTFASSSLAEFFTLLSTNADRAGMRFVSSMEGKKYPIFAVQWHPEKNPYEWLEDSAIVHSDESVGAVGSLARTFVREARQNGHHFATLDAEWQSLIWNYSPVYTGKTHSDFEQTYFFA
ncbi:putative Gamma-glutamyl hydrolase A [Paratrimastix pyriformis]|uniref:folate gamma-glutamyl hydrolase n=1 Tax=Paratrimastix pyriformis TaxID=342808 RepID=A0ABQ8UKI0_9EUKA|nr:putative Gamma-glutamyl hydrolase A [Paratrimastix pyriformis]